jgi:hypothetical protein
VDTLKIAELVRKGEHRRLVGLQDVEDETPDLAHVAITLRSRLAARLQS